MKEYNDIKITEIEKKDERTIVVRVNWPRLLCHEFVTVDSNVKDGAVVCCVDNRNETYELTIRKNTNKTPVNLNGKDFIDIQVCTEIYDGIHKSSEIIRFSNDTNYKLS